MELGPINSFNKPIMTNVNGEVTKKTVENESTEETNAESTEEDQSETNYAQSFVYGALGLDQPGELEESDNFAYSTGQVLKAIGTVGSIIAIVV